MNENEVKLVPIPDADSPNFKELLALPRKTLKLRRIWAISAYYDLESIKQLIKYMRDHSAKGKKSANLELIIVLDRGAGARADEDLKKLDRKIRNKFGSADSGIYLSSFGELFHSKGYLVESQEVGKCAVGSLNLTQQGLTKNAELLAFFDYRIASKSCASKFANHFKKYVKKILKHAHPASKASGMPSRTGNNLRDFFLEGRLYYEANEVGPFGFKLKLPEDFLKGRADIIPYLKTETSDILDVRELIGLKLEQVENRQRSLWKRYCFQTCYGYWAPACHFEDIRRQIEKSKGRLETYKKTFDTLETEREKIFAELLKACWVLASKMKSDPNAGKNWKFLSEDGQDLDERELHQSWSDWFCQLMRKNQEEFISRLCRDIQYVRMPNIWEDRGAIEDFVESFKQSFLYELHHKNKSPNKLFRLLKDHGAINDYGAIDNNSLEEAIKSLNKAIREGNQSAKNQQQAQTKQARLPDSQA